MTYHAYAPLKRRNPDQKKLKEMAAEGGAGDIGRRLVRGGEGNILCDKRTFSAGTLIVAAVTENDVFVHLYVIRLNDGHNKASGKVYLRFRVFTKSVNIF